MINKGYTFKTINGWTKKKVIKCIKKHVHGMAESGIGGECLYETSQGNRCAIGAFLDHNIHSEKIFSFFGPITHVLLQYPEIAKTLPFTLNALKQLQNIHDNWGGEGDIIYNNENYNAPEDALIAWVENNVE